MTRAAATPEVINEMPGFNIYGLEQVIEPAHLSGEAGKTNHRAVRYVAAAAAVALAGMQFAGCSNENDSADNNGDVAGTELEVAAENTENCPTSWDIEQINHGSRNRVLDEGVASIGTAETNPQARQAFQVWLDIIKQDPDMLAGNATAILRRPVNADRLVSNDGECASRVAVRTSAEVEAEVLSGEVTAQDPSAWFTNTGVNGDGELVAGRTPGLTGDLSGISIELRDGTKFGILERCGNLVLTNPRLPGGPTDNPRPPRPPEQPPTPTVPGVPPKVDDGYIPGPGGVTPTTQAGPTGSVINDPANYHPTTSDAPRPPQQPNLPPPTTPNTTSTTQVPPTTRPPQPQG